MVSQDSNRPLRLFGLLTSFSRLKKKETIKSNLIFEVKRMT